MNVVTLGTSTSQCLLLIPVALLLLVCAVLYLKNHRTLSPGWPVPVPVLSRAGFVCPANLVSRSPAVVSARLSTRAPPTSHSTSTSLRPDLLGPGASLMVHVEILLTDFR
jgi:hypothetical protein